MKAMYCRLEFRTGSEPETDGPYGAMFFFQNQYLEPNAQYIFFLNIELKKNPFNDDEPSDEMLLGWVLNQFDGYGCVRDISVYKMPKQE